MIDLSDYKAVRTWAKQLQVEEQVRLSVLLRAADHINANCDKLRREHKVSANNAERMRLELLAALVHGAKVPESYLT